MNTDPATRHRDISTGLNATLRVAIVRDAGAGELLILSHGFGCGDAFHRPGYCGSPLVLPAGVVGELRSALEALDGQG